MVRKKHDHSSQLNLVQRLTCGALLQLVVFLFPPLPRPEQTPQRGQFTVAADGRGVHPTDQTAGAQNPLLFHQVYRTQNTQDQFTSHTSVKHCDLLH